MFRKGSIQDPELTMVYSAADMMEAEHAKSILGNEGIPSLLMDREDSGQYLRILGYGSPFGIDVYVSNENAQRAREILAYIFAEDNSVSEEELEELALETAPENCLK